MVGVGAVLGGVSESVPVFSGEASELGSFVVQGEGESASTAHCAVGGGRPSQVGEGVEKEPIDRGSLYRL